MTHFPFNGCPFYKLMTYQAQIQVIYGQQFAPGSILSRL